LVFDSTPTHSASASAPRSVPPHARLPSARPSGWNIYWARGAGFIKERTRRVYYVNITGPTGFAFRFEYNSRTIKLD